MLMQVKTNGATDLIINLNSDNVSYVQDMIRMFENNVVAVQCNYQNPTTVELDSTIHVGKHVKFEGNANGYSEPHPDLIVDVGESADILKNYEPLPLEQRISVKEQMKKLNERNTTLSKENDYLKDQIKCLEAKVKELELDNL